MLILDTLYINIDVHESEKQQRMFLILSNSNKKTNSANDKQTKDLTVPLINTSFSCKCPLLGQAESGQLIAVSRPSLIRSSTYCFRH